MKEASFSHPCPEADCAGEVTLSYEAGASGRDFILIPDESEIRCDRGHGPFPASQIRKWGDRDWVEMGERLYAQIEEAQERYWEEWWLKKEEEK